MGWSRDAAKIAAEAALDGIYVVRTSLGKESIGGEAAVAALQEPRARGARLQNHEILRTEGPPLPRLQ